MNIQNLLSYFLTPTSSREPAAEAASDTRSTNVFEKAIKQDAGSAPTGPVRMCLEDEEIQNPFEQSIQTCLDQMKPLHEISRGNFLLANQEQDIDTIKTTITDMRKLYDFLKEELSKQSSNFLNLYLDHAEALNKLGIKRSLSQEPPVFHEYRKLIDSHLSVLQQLKGLSENLCESTSKIEDDPEELYYKAYSCGQDIDRLIEGYKSDKKQYFPHVVEISQS